MAQQNALLEAGGRLVGSVLNSGLTAIIILVIVGAVGGTLYYFLGYRRKFNILVKIISERASDPRILFDWAAILNDRKQGTKYLKLLSLAVEIPLPSFRIIESTNRGDYLELWRKSEDEFVYLTKPKIDQTKVIKADGRAYPVARPLQRHLESDIYWMVKRREDNKKLLSTDALWAKLLAWAPQIIGGVIVMLMLWITLSKLPGLIQILIELTKEVKSLKGATTIVA